MIFWNDLTKRILLWAAVLSFHTKNMKRRVSLVLLAVIGSSAGGQVRQIPARVPLETVVHRAETETLATLLRLLQHGSGADRARTRCDLLRVLPSVREHVELELAHANQFLQTELILVHMAEGQAPDVLRKLASGSLRGERGLAALALAIGGRGEDFTHILSATRSAQSEDKRKAMLALGRLGGEAAESVLIQQLSSGTELDRLTALLGLALARAAPPPQQLLDLYASREDRVRRAVLLVAGNARQGSGRALLLRGLEDEDAVSRRIALEGLALATLSATELEQVAKHWKRLPEGADLERARLLLALVANGWQEDTRVRAAAERAADIRLRVVAAAAALWQPRCLELSRTLLADQEASVRTAALVSLAHAGAADETLLLHARDQSELVRRAALFAHVWRSPHDPQPGLAKVDASPHADVRQLARELALEWERDPEAARRVAAARLQTLLDDTGAAVSWNLRMSLEDQLHEVLDLKNALPRGGGGAAPGGGGAAGRALGAAASRVSVADEDLKRHLDVWPLAAVRERWELAADARRSAR